jgi:cofilin
LKQQGAKKTNKKYIIFALNPKLTEIVVEKVSEDPSYEEFLGSLPENEPRYAVYDANYEAEDGGQRNKLVFVAWYVSSQILSVYC